jgi:hypothetical protein
MSTPGRASRRVVDEPGRREAGRNAPQRNLSFAATDAATEPISVILAKAYLPLSLCVYLAPLPGYVSNHVLCSGALISEGIRGHPRS